MRKGKKVGALLGLMLLGTVSLTGCKEKTNTAYYQGQAQAEQAFEVKGNTKLDARKKEGNLGLAASEKINNGKSTGSQSSGTEQQTQSQTQATQETKKAGEVYEYVVNYDTMFVHTRDCDDVDLKVPTFKRYGKSLDDAIAEGYITCPSCIGWKKDGAKAQ